MISRFVKRRRYALLVGSLAVLMAVFLAGQTLAAGSSGEAWQVYQVDRDRALQEYVLGNPVSPGEPFTVTTHVRLDTSETGQSGFGEPSGVSEEVWLAGVAGAAGERPTLLALTWRMETSSWFPVWRLYLQSDAGLLPGQQSEMRLESVLQPMTDVDYTTVFSYDPAQGVLSVRITEEKSGQILHCGNWELDAYKGVLYPGLGFQGPSEEPPFAKMDGLVVQSLFVPIGARARLLTREIGEEFFTNVAGADRRDEWALDVSLPNRRLENDVRFVLDDGTERSVLLSLDTTGKQVIPLSPESMPAGTTDFILEYEVGGTKWELDRTQLQIGAVDVSVESLELVVGEHGEPELAGIVRVASDGEVPPFDLEIGGNVEVPGRATPLHERWERASVSTMLSVAGLGVAPIELPFRFPLGNLAGSVDGKEVFATVSIAAEVDVPFFTRSGISRVVLGERAAVFPKVGEYTVLRGDFHVHTTLSDGELVPQDRVWETYMYGYDTMALTDHRTMAGYDGGSALAESLGLVLIRGFETGIEGKQHLVVLGADSSYQPRDEHQWSRQPNQTRVFYQDQVKEVIAHGGLILYAHPGGNWVPPGPYTYAEGPLGWSDEIQWMVDQGHLHGVESRGHLEAERRDSSFRWALEHGLTLFDVTDVHGPRNFNRGDQTPLTLVLAKESTPEGVLEALWDGRTLIWRNGQLRGTEKWLVPFMDAVIDVSVVVENGTPRLRVTNNSALGVFGAVVMPDGGQGTLWLPAFTTAYLSGDVDAETLSIRWGNVQDRPGQAFVSEHRVRHDQEALAVATH